MRKITTGLLAVIASCLVYLCAAGRAPAAGTQQAFPEMISAQSFCVVGPDGKPRAMLARTPADGVGLALTDTDRRNRLILNVAPDGTPTLVMFDATRKARLNAALTPGGDPVVLLTDGQKEGSRIQISFEAGRPFLRTYDAEGKIIWRSPIQ